MEGMVNLNSFFAGKRVLVTGHTGFKGTWLCQMLIGLHADVTGYSLEPPTKPSLFELSKMDSRMNSFIGDIRDYGMISDVFKKTCPEIVFHLAAQPIVRDGYKDPRYTYDTNVMGTVNVLDCIRTFGGVRSVVIVTTDKVYLNKEQDMGYVESDELDGFDPYSNSKSCAELVTHSFKRSFFDADSVAVSTVRAGNVIGGGDFANDRIIPDCVRAVVDNKTIKVRNPHSIRPYQHVLEPLAAYLKVAEMQYYYGRFADCYNVGPDDNNCITTGELASLFCEFWGGNAKWEDVSESGAPHEASILKLNCQKIKNTIKWMPLWNIEKCIAMTCGFEKRRIGGENIEQLMNEQIEEYFVEESKNANVE